MSIRLNKVTRDLNVGITTVVDFLGKKGYTVDANPNTKISDEQYAILVKEFSKDKNIKKQSERFIQERQKKDHRSKSSVAKDSKKEEVAKVDKVKPAVKEVETVVPELSRPKFKPVGKIDLDSINKPKSKVESTAKKATTKNEEIKHQPQEVLKKSENKAEEVKQKNENLKEASKEKSSHKSDKTVSPKTNKTTDSKVKASSKPKTGDAHLTKIDKKEETPKVKTENKEKKASDGVFKLHDHKPEANIKVVGQIDLSALNQSTRPKKKTKEEKRKEREEKEKTRQDHRKHSKDNRSDHKPKTASSENRPKKRRSRINEKVDINSEVGNNARPHTRSNAKNTHNKRGKGNFKKPIIKQEVSEEDVAKQVKETLARLTNKGKSKTSKYRKEKRDIASKKQQEKQQSQETKVLKLTEFVTVNELATMMDVTVNEVIATCMNLGVLVSINQRLDAEVINLVVEEFGFETEYVSAEVVEAVVEEEDDPKDLVSRAPIVTVMGHVDHGKTSLLDYIRKENVIAGEAGGITQHIGAYNVKMSDGRRITFLDTPGHEAFTAMRARGAKVTDVAIIIVAADDDVMPQTKEAINHASAANVPIVFAINKVDKQTSNPDKIKEQLASLNYLVEDWGGKYQSQDISAKKGTGVKELMEKVLLESELLDLKANPNRKGTGSVIESTLDKGRGYVATILVSNGTLKIGDIVLSGSYYGRVKAMFNERNQRVEEAGPSAPVLVLGLNGAPAAGDTFHVVDSEHEAREIANKREQLQREQGLRTQKMLTLDELGRRIALGNFQELNIIVKGDVDGSVEALSDSLIRLSTEQIQVNVIHKGVGQISESDVSLAAASEAIIVGFQVRPSASASRMAEKEGIDIRKYSVIYDAIEEVKSAMEGMLAPTLKEQINSTVEIREVFNITKVGLVAGAVVKTGKAKRSDKARLIRDGIVIFTGSINALKRFKDDVKEVGTNFECGISLVNCNDMKVGDIIETFEEIEVKQKL